MRIESRAFIVRPLFKLLNLNGYFAFLAIPLILLLASCGMKGPPKLSVYEIPSVPKNIEVTQKYYPRQVVLRWDYPEGQRESVHGFVVLRSSSNGKDREMIVSGTVFTDSDLDEDAVYNYSLRAISMSGDHGDVSSPISVNPVKGLSEPGDITFDIDKDVVTMKWSYPEVNASFNIYNDEAPGPVNHMPVRDLFIRLSPNPDMTTTYFVRAVSEANIMTIGPQSEKIVIGPDDYVPARPSGLGFALTDSKVLLFWNENPESWIRGYTVYRKLEEDGNFLPLGKSETPAFEDKDDMSYRRFYVIRAIGPSKEGPSSETIVVEPKR